MSLSHLIYIFRYSVKDLLQHNFFLDDNGLRLEIVETEGDSIQFQLRVVDPKKRKDKHKENEAIQFGFDLGSDDPDQVAQEMVISIYIIIYGTFGSQYK